jgi:outer membrane usher protein
MMIMACHVLEAQTQQRVLLPVKVNEISHGEVLSFVAGDDVLVPKSFLDTLGIPTGSATPQQLEGEPYFSLRALAASITYAVNADDLTLSITVDPRLLGHHVLDLERKGAVAERGGDPAAFFNYALNGAAHGTPTFFGELGASRGHSLLFSGFSRTAAGLSRGMSFLSVESPSNLRRWTIGDALVGSDPIGGTVAIGGVTLARDFTLQPYLVHAPAVDVTGTATTPSTVEVYVNGQLTNRIEVNPGVFTLRDLPATGGLGTTQLVIRDAFGRETVQQSSFYYSTTALRRGFSEYVFSAGAIRGDFTKSLDYHGGGAIGQYRRGITDHFTLGGRGEASEGVVSAGPRVTLGTNLGDFDAEVAASSGKGATGNAATLLYRFTTLRYSFGVAATHRSDRYATLSLAPADDRVTRDLNVFVATSVGRLSLGGVGAINDTRSGDRIRRLSLQATVPLSRWGNLFASLGTVDEANKRSPEVLIGLTLSIGRLTTASALFQKSQGVDGLHVELRQPLSQANGLGYAVQSDTATNSQSAELQYQTSFGRYEIDANPKDAGATSVSAAGGLVYLGGAFMPSRAIQNGYAMARVGVPNVKVFSSNQEVGRTNAAGDLLVPNLLPYYANDLRISDKDVPMNYVVDGTQVTVLPPSRGGVVAKFPLHRIRSYTGKVIFMIIGQPYTPSLGEVDVHTKGAAPQTLSLGRNGEFYVDDLDPGTFRASLRIGKVGCDFNLVLPATDAAVTDLGVIECSK